MQTLPTTLSGFFGFFLKKEWKILLAIQFFFLGWAFDQTLWPLIIEKLIDTLNSISSVRDEMWTAILPYVFMGLGLLLYVELSFRAAGFLTAIGIPRIEAHIRTRMFEYVQNHSYTYFSNNFAGNISNKISDMVDSFSNIIKKVTSVFLPVLVAVIISTTLFAQLHTVFAIILFSWVVIYLSISFLFIKGCDLRADIHSEARSVLSGDIVDSLSNNMTVKLYSRLDYENHQLQRLQKDEQKKHTSALFYTEKMRLALGITSLIGTGVALNWYMLSSWKDGSITTGELVFIFNSAWNIIMMVWVAAIELPDLFRELGRCRQALRLIQEEHGIKDAPSAKEIIVPRGGIFFDHVTFRYNRGHSLFQDKTIAIHPGQKTGLVGFSGSGKTTFMHLILRFYDIQQGKISIDGQDISKVTQHSLRKNIAMIPQDTSLFHRTILENIRYGKLDASKEEVIEAAKRAHCHEFIERFPDGYDTIVGERGSKLSGGQRQRIAIARAILKNAPIFILDEATSALDTVTERYIQDALKYLMEGRTTLVIAHRLSTLIDMTDRILVFSDGRVIEDGVHEELLYSGGHYAQMWGMQAEGFLPDNGAGTDTETVTLF